jgi:hypothetical protein
LCCSSCLSLCVAYSSKWPLLRITCILYKLPPDSRLAATTLCGVSQHRLYYLLLPHVGSCLVDVSYVRAIVCTYCCLCA